MVERILPASGQQVQTELLPWQIVRYGDKASTRAALAFYRERGWSVDDQHGPDSLTYRIFAFISGWEAMGEAMERAGGSHV